MNVKFEWSISPAVTVKLMFMLDAHPIDDEVDNGDLIDEICEATAGQDAQGPDTISTMFFSKW